MAKIIGLPKLSPTMEEGTLAAWIKKEGEDVDIDDLLAEVETDKATMEFRSFDKGVLLKILVPAGETLAPDTPVAIIGQRGEDISALIEEAASRTPTSVGAPAPETASAAVPTPVASPVAKPVASPVASPVAGMARRADGRIIASPLVRRLARERGLDLAGVIGTGPRARIIKRDLENVSASSGSAPVSGAPGVRLPPRVVKASSMRKTIARRLTESKQTVPHFYLTIDLDAAPMMTARKQMNSLLDGEKVSFNDIVIKAAAVALRNVPECNASWMGDSIHYHQVVDVSVAVAVPDGLVTPVIRNADYKGVLTISREVKDLATRARNKKLGLEEMQNGTFSISNLGMYGIEEFAAVINPPEGALMAVGGIRDAAVVQDGVLVPGKRMKVTLSCDHRVVDGAVGAQWLREFKRLLEAPYAMLL